VLSEQLQNALSSRIALEQAKGISAERINLTMDEATCASRWLCATLTVLTRLDVIRPLCILAAS
jgi:hypothetical protein